MALDTYKIKLVGRTPLVMHNPQCVDRRHPLQKQMAAITNKGKRKTEADLEQLDKLGFVSSLYICEELGPYVPAQNLRKMLIESARKSKQGKQFEAGVFVVEDVPVQYDGPRDFEEMWALKDKFAWTCVVGNQQSSILRTRARFQKWELDFEVMCEDSLVSRIDIENALKHAEIAVGLCDGRSVGCGRFKAEIVG
jgi:hypothetical protein